MKIFYKIVLISSIFAITGILNSALADRISMKNGSSYILEDTIKKVCKISDSTLLSEIKQKKDKLNEELGLLNKEKNDLEKLIRETSENSKENKRKLKNLISDIKRVEKESDKLNNKIYSILRCVEDKYLDNGKSVIRFLGGGTIEKEDKINSNVCITNGNLYVKGILNGDLAILNGNVIIIDSGKIEGKIILFNSGFTGDTANRNFIMCGEIGDYREYSSYTYNSFPRFYGFPGFHFPPTDFIDDGICRYNRVEGLYLGMKSTKKYYWNERKQSSFYSSLGYGFGNHRWSGNLGFDRWVGNENRTEFGVEMHSLVDSKDNRLIDPLENSLAAFFIREDFKDYFMREGFNVHIAQYLNKFTRFRIDYFEDNYESLSRNVEWSLFGGDKTFRENPIIDDGRYQSIILSLNHVTVDNKQYHPEGWDISADYEITSGKYSYNRLSVDLRRYQPLDIYNRINFRIFAGTSEKYLPLQRNYEIGGLGTLPALPFKAFKGNRILLGNIEYLMGINDFFTMLFDDDFHFGDRNDVIFFYDAGWVDQVSDDFSLFKGFEIDDKIRQDFGVALGFDRNSVRVGVACRLDKPEPVTFFFRISRPF
jgi:hypothetical protein